MRLIGNDKNRNWSARSAVALAVLLATLLHSVLAFAQKPEYEFYFEFRKDFAPKLQEENHWSLTDEQVFEKYAAKLKGEGIAESEIVRRIRLIRTEHLTLEADYWSRYYLDATPILITLRTAFSSKWWRGSGRAWRWTMEWGRAETLST